MARYENGSNGLSAASPNGRNETDGQNKTGSNGRSHASPSVSERSRQKVKGGIFTPAIALMNNLKYPYKFVIISILLDVPSFILIALLTNVRNEAIDFGAKEQLGLEYNRPLKELLVHITDHRRAALQQASTDAAVKDAAARDLESLDQKIKTDIAAVDAIDAKLGETLAATEKWKSVKKSWTDYSKETMTLMAETEYTIHTSIIDEIVSLLYHVGDTSNLVLDPDIDTYYLMDGVVFRLPLLVQKISLARDLSSRVAQGDTLSPDKVAELVFVQPGVVQSTYEGIQTGIAKASEFSNANPAAPKVRDLVSKDYAAATAAVNRFLQQTSSIKKVDLDSSFDAKRHADAGSIAIEKLMTLYDTEALALGKLIQVRIEAFKFQRTVMQIGVPILWLIVIYLLIGFYRSVMRTVNSLGDISEKLIGGNTTEKVTLEAKDELATVGEAFNSIGQALVERNHELELNKTQLERSFSLLEDSYKKVEAANHQIQEQQTQLIQSEKMSSLGQMVAGIAHEVNTPLGFVRNNIEVIERNQKKLFEILTQYRSLRESLINGDLDDLETKLTEISVTAEKVETKKFIDRNEAVVSESLIGLDRIQELVLNLKDFSRLDEASFKLSDLNKGIDSTLMIANNVIKYKVRIEKQYTDGLTAECYPSRLNQVFLNLITNAAQAIPEGTEGVVFIITYREKVGETDMAVVKIADNGAGIPAENLKKIFEPFFTTKPIGQGTGLGLSIVFKIIEQHKGTISVQSEIGKGTEFTIKLPLKQKRAAESKSVAQAV
ncbi:MAG: hypothetical protein IAF08_11610 [Rhizobacter sp.]|nr:hypothetical protein [Chlorobiales bacterium]